MANDVTILGAARLLRILPQTVVRLMRDGRLPQTGYGATGPLLERARLDELHENLKQCVENFESMARAARSEIVADWTPPPEVEADESEPEPLDWRRGCELVAGWSHMSAEEQRAVLKSDWDRESPLGYDEVHSILQKSRLPRNDK